MCRTMGDFVRIASINVIVAVVRSKIYVMENENFIAADGRVIGGVFSGWGDLG